MYSCLEAHAVHMYTAAFFVMSTIMTHSVPGSVQYIKLPHARTHSAIRTIAVDVCTYHFGRTYSDSLHSLQ